MSLLVLMLLTFTGYAFSRDLIVKGTITDILGGIVPNAKVTMVSGSKEYSAVSGTNGKYTLKIPGIYSDISEILEPGVPYPNPFSHAVNIPFMTGVSGDVLLTIYNIAGQKITDMLYQNVSPGSYQLIWDGCNDNGTPVRQGFYIYVLNFNGQRWSGRLIKAQGYTTYAANNSLESVFMPPTVEPSPGSVRIPVITNVSSTGYYPVRLTDIVLKQDTVVDFVLAKTQALPFKTQDKYIAMNTGTGYRNMLIKGVNLGSSPPGTFPGEIAYAISDEYYRDWIARMAQAGFNILRVYTLHPPVFYEMLAEYNQRHQDKPLLLVHGIWLDEPDDYEDPFEYDLTLRETVFKQEIKDLIDVIHGNKKIAARPGKAYGDYYTDISRWTVGYVLGREILPEEVLATNSMHPEMNVYNGGQFSIKNGSASEVFLTKMIDQAVAYENQTYSIRRPVGISSWPSLDPLTHPGEQNVLEDSAVIDAMKIEGKEQQAGMFIWYHAYPYFPNFISQQTSYQSYRDSQGPNSYLGYLTELKSHYQGVPLVIGEYGVPSSWGDARLSFSNMDHGGMSEQQQGEKFLRMMHNIQDTGCAGGFLFAWMDEWFKTTWIVSYLEAYGFNSGGALIPTRNLWHNITSPEENFGLLAFDEIESNPFVTYQTDKPTGPLTRIDAKNDNAYFYVDIQTSAKISKGDTIMVAFDTYKADTGESRLPNGKHLSNRSEFLLTMVTGQDTAIHNVTQAYDMKGVTKYGDFSDPTVQKYKSTVTDGAPWVLMRWVNSHFTNSSFNIGKLPAENAVDFTPGQRTALAWSDNKIKVRIPWTMLYMYDPTQLKVIDGAVTKDGGTTFDITTASSDGIAVSVYCKGVVTSTATRYKWEPWTVVPLTKIREKKSLQLVEDGLKAFPSFVN